MRFALTTTLTVLLSTVVLWFVEEIDILTPGRSFGGGDWPSSVLWLMGAILSVVLVPVLYVSSYRHSRNPTRLWAVELSTIPLVVFWAIFLQYASDLCMFGPLIFIFFLSILLILCTHVIVLVKSHVTLSSSRYLMTLWGIAAFYVVFAITQWQFNVLWHLKYGARDVLWKVFGH